MAAPSPAHRIAIADDSPAFLAAAARYIASLPGYLLAGTASSAAGAVALVDSSRPDVLLLDLGLAPRSTLEMLRRIKAGAHAPAIIALTLFHAHDIEAQARSAGADAIVSKEAFVSGLAEALPSLLAPRAA